jgi:hypothetical protein
MMVISAAFKGMKTRTQDKIVLLGLRGGGFSVKERRDEIVLERRSEGSLGLLAFFLAIFWTPWQSIKPPYPTAWI